MSQTAPGPTPSLAKSYSPIEHEDAIRARWDAAGAFHADPADSPAKPPFCILIPPPNVTGALHLGHAFNNTLQDILTRFHRLREFNALWMPGTDHAAISTQAVVEKRLLLQGKRRTDYTREQFIAIVQEWKDEYEATIIAQLKAMGCSCDFTRTRFTMDEVCTRAVREAFFRLFKDGLIYRGKRLVNWDPATQTALADDEVEMEEVQGHMWYLRYPLVETEGFITVATTRPETMLGDTAVAINPKDPRAAQYVGKHVKLPIVDRVIPIVADDYVVRPVQYGGDPNDSKSAIATGFLKVTPAHDPNDWEIGRRHNLDVINIFAPDATISDKHGWSDISNDARPLVGLAREQARKAIVEWFKAHGLLEEAKPYTHSVGHSYRSNVPIEPYLSDQWYVKVTDDRMKGEALRSMAAEQYEGARPARSASEGQREAASGPRTGDDDLRFFPARYARSFQAWHENLRDWCISRQLWWGHRIPVWFAGPFPIDQGFADQLNTWIAEERIAIQEWHTTTPDVMDPDTEHPVTVNQICVRDESDVDVVSAIESHMFTRDEDVLDTWFSSGLWPLSTMGWPTPGDFPTDIPEGEALLDTFNPSTVLLTAREIITLWVSRMVMFNRHFRGGTLPFEHVYIHAMIQDGHGQKMSKSLGNGVDPRDIIHSHGADAMRFVLCQIATQTQDVRMPVDMVCPHEGCGHVFTPKETTTPAGYRVAAPEQSCPACKKKMISGYGAATGLATPSDETPQARNTSSRFDLGRNFANKLWNATKFALMNLAGPSPTEARGLQSPGFESTTRADKLALIDRWMLSRLARTTQAVEAALAEYQFATYAELMYDLVWRDFCDWYVESIKPTIKNSPSQQRVLRTVLDAMLRLLHPIMPFVTEALWPHVAACGFAPADGVDLPPSELLATATWPRIDPSIMDAEAEATFARAQSLVEHIRNLRGEHKVQPRQKIRLLATDGVRELIEQASPIVQTLAVLEAVDDVPKGAKPQAPVLFTFEGREQGLTGLADAVDPAAERARLTKLIQDKEQAIRGMEGRLNSPGYVEKAPAKLVEETRAKLAEAQSELAAAKRSLELLGL